jgi:hypothetical protein
MEDRPREGEEFSVWYYRWQELIRQTEAARGKLIDDDIKCAVALRRAPRELKDHLVLQSNTVADRFSVMHEIIVVWMTARRSFGQTTSSSTPAGSREKDPIAMDVGHLEVNQMTKGYNDKGFGQKGKYGKFGDKGFGKKGKGPGYGKGYGFKGKAVGKSGGKGEEGKAYSKGGGKTYGKDLRGIDTFHGYCGGCWQWGHKKAHCPQRTSRMEIGATSVSSSPMFSATPSAASSVSGSSARIQAVSAAQPSGEWCEEDDEDWPDDSYWYNGWSEWWTPWDWSEEAETFGEFGYEEAEDAEELHVFAIKKAAFPEVATVGESKQVHKLMIDSGSQSTACRPDFAPEYAIDDSEKAKLWDIQDQQIEAYGKKVVDVNFLGDRATKKLPGQLRFDVGKVGKNVASMGMVGGEPPHYFGRVFWGRRGRPDSKYRRFPV